MINNLGADVLDRLESKDVDSEVIAWLKAYPVGTSTLAQVLIKNKTRFVQGIKDGYFDSEAVAEERARIFSDLQEPKRVIDSHHFAAVPSDGMFAGFHTGGAPPYDEHKTTLLGNRIITSLEDEAEG